MTQNTSVPGWKVLLVGLSCVVAAAGCQKVEPPEQPEHVAAVKQQPLVTDATPPNFRVENLSFENSAKVVPPSAPCPKGGIAFNLGQDNYRGIAFRPLFNASGAIDTTTPSTRVFFPNSATTALGTDNQIVRLKDGSLLAERDAAVWGPINPAPAWANEWISGGGVVKQLNRGSPVLFRSTDCGQTWGSAEYSIVDFGSLAGGIYGAPRPKKGDSADVGCPNQDTYNNPGSPEHGKRDWWIGGMDRTEIYSCPFTGNVYVTTRVKAGPVCAPAGDTRLNPDQDTGVLLASTDKGVTWNVITTMPQYSPMVLTSTPNGRLFMFQQIAQPTIYYSQPLTAGQLPVMSTPYPVFYVDAANNPVPQNGPTSLDFFVQVGQPSISRVSLDRTTSKVRVSYQARNASGMQQYMVARVEVGPDGGQPLVKNIATVGAASPTDHSAMYLNFNDPDYIDMPAGARSNSSMAYWIEAPRCRTGEFWSSQPDGTSCGNTCSNLQADFNNCGACGHACAAGQLCSAGVCSASPCGAGLSQCGAGCVNVQTDPRNCGFCGNQCAFDASCVAGACSATTSSNYGVRHMFFEGDCRATTPRYLSVNNTDEKPRTWNTQMRLGDYAAGGFWWDGKLNYLAHWSEPFGAGLVAATTSSPFGLSQPDRHIFNPGRTQADFSAYDNLARSEGWQTVDLGTYMLSGGGGGRIDGVWQKSNVQTTWAQGYAYDDFSDLNDDLAAEGWSIDKLHSFVLPDGQVRVDALWSNLPRAWSFTQGYTQADFETERDSLVSQGYRLDYLQSFVLKEGGIRIDSVWHHQPGGSLYIQGYTVEDFLEAEQDFRADGWRIDQLQSFVLNDGGVRVDAVWHQGPEQTYWVRGYALQDFLNIEADLRCQNFQLQTLHSFVLSGGEVRIDAVWHRPEAPKPTALCQDIKLPADATCSASVTADMINNGSFSAGGDALTFTMNHGAAFSKGITNVTLTATDSFGSSATCTAKVEIADVTPPTFTTTPAAVTVDKCVNPTLTKPVATDNCDGAIAASNVTYQPTSFAVGTNNYVTWTAKDSANNANTTFQQVTTVLGDDSSCCPAGTNIIVGTSGANNLTGTSGADCILGLGGNDVIAGNDGNDYVSGGSGDDTIATHGGNDFVWGGPGNDIIDGSLGNDFIDGGTGTDQCAGQNGTNVVVNCEDTSGCSASCCNTYTCSVPPAATACDPPYARSDCSSYVVGTIVSKDGHDWKCTNGNCAACASQPNCAPGASGCSFGTVWSDTGSCDIDYCASAPVTPAGVASSSNENASFPASNAIDGNPSTRWSSAFSDAQWLRVDLGTTRYITRMTLQWEAAYSSSYTIQVSDNTAGPWTTIYTDRAGNGGLDDITGLSALARYVRVNSTARGTQYGNSLWEVEVFASTFTDCAGPLPLASTSATSSGNESASFGPNNARDNNTGTRWSSAFSDPQWIYFDLGATYNVRRVVLDWEAAYSTQFDIQVSNNTTSWTTIFTNNAGNGGVDNITNLTGSGRYVRMLGRARNTQYGHSLWDVQIYGTP